MPWIAGISLLLAIHYGSENSLCRMQVNILAWLQVFPEQNQKWVFNPSLSRITPIDLQTFFTLPQCTGASSIDTFHSENRVYLIVAVYYDPDRGGYAAPSLVYEIVSRDGQSIEVARKQSIPTKAAYDVDTWSMGFIESSGSKNMFVCNSTVWCCAYERCFRQQENNEFRRLRNRAGLRMSCLSMGCNDSVVQISSESRFTICTVSTGLRFFWDILFASWNRGVFSALFRIHSGH